MRLEINETHKEVTQSVVNSIEINCRSCRKQLISIISVDNGPTKKVVVKCGCGIKSYVNKINGEHLRYAPFDGIKINDIQYDEDKIEIEVQNE